MVRLLTAVAAAAILLATYSVAVDVKQLEAKPQSSSSSSSSSLTQQLFEQTKSAESTHPSTNLVSSEVSTDSLNQVGIPSAANLVD